MLTLHDYFRSSAAYRVRIALNLKGLDYAQLSCQLRDGSQRAPDFLTLNPQGLVPALATDGAVLTQSLAIIDYLDEVYPQPSLLPNEPINKARVRSLALQIACDIHPLNNLRVLNYLKNELGQTQENVTTWYRHWIAVEFAALEARLANDAQTGSYCQGEQISLADICLVPQVANARRFDCDLSACPTIVRIDAACQAITEFADAAPERQADAE